MSINNKIKSYTPEQLVALLVDLKQRGGFEINLNISIKPESNELSSKEACEFLKISYPKLIKSTEKGIVKMQKHGGKLCYFKDNLIETRKAGLI